MGEKRTVTLDLEEIRVISKALQQAYRIIFDKTYKKKPSFEDEFIDALVLVDMILEEGG